ncbi:MAG: MFS transporter [Actinobacteria bacterium]|nr:MFS transporter [Actinomycetota bacterium]
MTEPETSDLPGYLTTATLARSATESAGPAVLVVAIATLGSATLGSYLVACLTASAALGGPIVGALLDRSPTPRRGFGFAIASMAIGLTAVALLIGHAPIGVVMAMAVIAGVGYPAITGALSAQLPRLVPSAGLTHAYAADAATYSVAAVVAPPVAAALIAVSTTAPLWLPVALLGAALVVLRRLPLTAAPPAAEPTSLLDDLREGLRTIAHRVALRRTVIITTLGFAGTAAVFVSAPLLAQSLAGSLQFTGVILGAFAAGGVITALWFTRHPVTRPDRAIIVSTILSATTLALVGLAPTVPLLLVAAFAMGATEPPLVSAMFQVRARESAPRVQSQVFTTSASLRMTAFALATAACGALLVLGTWAVISFGVLLHVVALVLGLAVGPPLPDREHWVRRP